MPLPGWTVNDNKPRSSRQMSSASRRRGPHSGERSESKSWKPSYRDSETKKQRHNAGLAGDVQSRALPGLAGASGSASTAPSP
jgi:hypothetical protein